MKKSLVPVLLLAATTVCAAVANAAPAPGPKRPGPSAVEAARLKKNPPPNYLSHYLPDDRYKIAGGVWKYVSTDLDTYYHIPSSPNMLRQPANRVIGFANARDAEEAGYVADPTDGTASKAAPPVSRSGGFDANGYSPEENLYRKQLAAIVDEWAASYMKFDRKFTQFSGSTARQPNGDQNFLIGLKSFTKDFVVLSRNALKRIRQLRPPARFQKVHRLLVNSFTSWQKFATSFDQLAASGDFLTNPLIEDATKELARAKAYSNAAFKEMQSLKR